MYQTLKTKNSTRTIPMLDSVYRALKKQKVQQMEMQMQAEDWRPLEGFENLVFAGRNGKPVSNHTFQKTSNDIVKMINTERKVSSEKNKITYEPIEHVHPHALRHTFATRCFEAGMEAKSV